MRIPLWLLALLFAGWTAWVVNHYFCQKCGCCGAATEAGAETTGVPLFKWNMAAPEADNNFGTWKKTFLAKGGQGDTLLITGHYRAGEKNDSKYENLGLARAAALKAMLMPPLPDNRIRTSSKLVTDGLTDGGAAMESASFSWLKMLLKKDEGAIIESDNSVTILFPFNSTVKDEDPKVDAYLKTLGEQHKSDNVTFSIVGHTDNVGDDKENTALGLGRAVSIGKILSRYGIAAARIKTDSKGKAEPVADNGTEDGRHQNRRVVITVNR